MTTVTLMSMKYPVSFTVDDDVATKLLENAMAVATKKKEMSSAYVNRLLKWALENYKENDVQSNMAE